MTEYKYEMTYIRNGLRGTYETDSIEMIMYYKNVENIRTDQIISIKKRAA